jgi:hypothetical protein
MELESQLTDSIARLHQGRFPSGCHAEPVEASLSFTAKAQSTQSFGHRYSRIFAITATANATKIAGLNFGKEVVMEF